MQELLKKITLIIKEAGIKEKIDKLIDEHAYSIDSINRIDSVDFNLGVNVTSILPGNINSVPINFVFDFEKKDGE